jgi:hypothetical protein
VEVFRRKSVSRPSSSLSWATSRREVDSSGLKYFAAWPAASPSPSNWTANERMT